MAGRSALSTVHSEISDEALFCGRYNDHYGRLNNEANERKDERPPAISHEHF